MEYAWETRLFVAPGLKSAVQTQLSNREIAEPVLAIIGDEVRGIYTRASLLRVIFHAEDDRTAANFLRWLGSVEGVLALSNMKLVEPRGQI